MYLYRLRHTRWKTTVHLLMRLDLSPFIHISIRYVCMFDAYEDAQIPYLAMVFTKPAGVMVSNGSSCNKSCKFVTIPLRIATSAEEISRKCFTKDGSIQGRTEVRWRPGQETSSATRYSNLWSFGGKCTVLRKVLASCDIVGTFRRPPVFWRPGHCAPLPPSLRPWFYSSAKRIALLCWHHCQLKQ